MEAVILEGLPLEGLALEGLALDGGEFGVAGSEAAGLEAADFADRSNASELGGIVGGGGSGVFSLASSGVTRSTAIGSVAPGLNGWTSLKTITSSKNVR